MSNINTKFLSAAEVADYNTSHYWEFPQFQPGILDFINRNVTILPRIKTVAATGHPSRYREQAKLPSNAQFVNVRNGVADGSYGLTSVNADYGRVEKAAFLKCLVSRIQYTLFDKEVVQQQGITEETLTKDFNDMLADFYMVQNDKIWNGKGTGPDDSSSTEYSGILTQVKTKLSIATPYDFTTKQGDMVTDQIRAQIAKMLAEAKWNVWPTAVYTDPVMVERITMEERNREGTVQVVPPTMKLANGWEVPTINTPVGNLPLIPDAALKSTADAGKQKHTIAVVNENLIERHYLTSSTPRIFKMSQDEKLMDDYIAILFDTLVVKGAEQAHFIIEESI
ncbi:hypothetical protein CJ260_00850 [Megasphaera sp. ASD88]|uniref:hypothetical protein n=1 Tax=Megasphaera sp. ASD88 TaxID=2027407 RepID=UPI000BAB5C33|nr:hypothetical protein [Megasphaera sp. ASD88]PAV40017.1 hypothetical protein CJ260_00850 [Megasphaera sp. ASD88]